MNLLKKNQEKVNSPSFILKTIFCSLVIVFTFIIVFRRYKFIFPYLMPISVIIVFPLGIALIFLSVKERMDRLLKKFLILTGASAIGIPISFILHSLFYAPFIKLFGTNFWERIGIGDELFFFILATIMCPLAFLVGVIGSIVIFIRKES